MLMKFLDFIMEEIFFVEKVLENSEANVACLRRDMVDAEDSVEYYRLHSIWKIKDADRAKTQEHLLKLFSKRQEIWEQLYGFEVFPERGCHPSIPESLVDCDEGNPSP